MLYSSTSARSCIAKMRRTLRSLLGRHDVVVTAGASAATNIALRSLLEPGDEVVVCTEDGKVVVPKENDEIFRYAAGGFRDFTRIASSNPVMWRDICIANREALGPMLAAFADEMAILARQIGDADGDALLEIFERAKAARDRYVDGLN